LERLSETLTNWSIFYEIGDLQPPSPMTIGKSVLIFTGFCFCRPFCLKAVMFPDELTGPFCLKAAPSFTCVVY